MSSAAIVNPRELTILLPLPFSALSPNARVGWRRKAHFVKFYRRDAGIAAVAEMNRLRWPKDSPMEGAVIDLVFVFPSGEGKRRRDSDNLLASMKPAFDGLVDAKLLLDDHLLIPGQIRITETNSERIRPHVRLTLRERKTSRDMVYQTVLGVLDRELRSLSADDGRIVLQGLYETVRVRLQGLEEK